MVFTGPVLYFAFTLNENGKRFLDLFFFILLDNTPEIYFDNFFKVARENEKNI